MVLLTEHNLVADEHFLDHSEQPLTYHTSAHPFEGAEAEWS